MPTNRIRVVSDENGVSCKVWDKDGKRYNVTDVFEKVRGQVTAGGISTELDLKHGTNSLKAKLEFRANKKDLKFDVDESVIKQILELGATEEEGPE